MGYPCLAGAAVAAAVVAAAAVAAAAVAAAVVAVDDVHSQLLVLVALPTVVSSIHLAGVSFSSFWHFHVLTFLFADFVGDHQDHHLAETDLEFQ